VLTLGELPSRSLQVFTCWGSSGVFPLRCGASHTFTRESQWERDLRYYQHVVFAGSFVTALPWDRSTGIRPRCCCPLCHSSELSKRTSAPLQVRVFCGKVHLRGCYDRLPSGTNPGGQQMPWQTGASPAARCRSSRLAGGSDCPCTAGSVRSVICVPEPSAPCPAEAVFLRILLLGTPGKDSLSWFYCLPALDSIAAGWRG